MSWYRLFSTELFPLKWPYRSRADPVSFAVATSYLMFKCLRVIQFNYPLIFSSNVIQMFVCFFCLFVCFVSHASSLNCRKKRRDNSKNVRKVCLYFVYLFTYTIPQIANIGAKLQQHNIYISVVHFNCWCCFFLCMKGMLR